MAETIDDLIAVAYPASDIYGALHNTWSNISFDREELLLFLRRYNYYKNGEGKPFARNELPVLDAVLATNNLEHLKKLADGDYEVCRAAHREKMARKAATEMCVNGKYNVKTFQKISSLPLADYKLIVKRVQELVNIANDVTNQAATYPEIAGL